MAGRARIAVLGGRDNGVQRDGCEVAGDVFELVVKLGHTARVQVGRRLVAHIVPCDDRDAAIVRAYRSCVSPARTQTRIERVKLSANRCGFLGGDQVTPLVDG